MKWQISFHLEDELSLKRCGTKEVGESKLASKDLSWLSFLSVSSSWNIWTWLHLQPNYSPSSQPRDQYLQKGTSCPAGTTDWQDHVRELNFLSPSPPQWAEDQTNSPNLRFKVLVQELGFPGWGQCDHITLTELEGAWERDSVWQTSVLVAASFEDLKQPCKNKELSRARKRLRRTRVCDVHCEVSLAETLISGVHRNLLQTSDFQNYIYSALRPLCLKSILRAVMGRRQTNQGSPYLRCHLKKTLAHLSLLLLPCHMTCWHPVCIWHSSHPPQGAPEVGLYLVVHS